MSLIEAMKCPSPYIDSVEYESSDGTYAILQYPTLTLTSADSNVTYLKVNINTQCYQKLEVRNESVSLT